MTEGLPSIKEFPHDDRIWRVDWFGAVERNPQVFSEPTIQVIISPLASDYKDPASRGAVIDHERHSIRIGVGQLPIITVGSLWNNGTRQTIAAGGIESLSNIQISPDTVRQISSGHKEDDQWVIPPNYHTVGPGGLNAQCLAIEYKGDPFGIIIPTAEVIRFYYAHSTVLAHAAFFGEYKDPEQLIIGPDSKYYSRRGYCRLRVRSRFSDNDAFTIGRILHSPQAAEGAAMVHNSLAKDSINSKVALYPVTRFPFDARVTLKARVKRIKAGTRWRYLVFALDQCSGPFPFKCFIGDRENRNYQVDGESDDLGERERSHRKRARANQDSDCSNGPLQSREEPSTYSDVHRISSAKSQFKALQRVTYKKHIPKSNAERKKLETTWVDMPTEDLGTGKGVNSENKTRTTRIDTNHDRRPMPDSFTSFAANIEALNKVDGCVASIRPPSDAIRYVPLKATMTGVPIKRQWSYLDYIGGSGNRRRVIIADAIINQVCLSIVEFEKRNKENYKLALLIKDAGGRLDDAEVAHVLREMAKKAGRWDKVSVLGICILKTSHTWRSSEVFAEDIMRLVSENMALR